MDKLKQIWYTYCTFALYFSFVELTIFHDVRNDTNGETDFVG